MKRRLLTCFLVLAVLSPVVVMAGGQGEEAGATGAEETIVLNGTWGIQHPGWELREDNILDPLLLNKYNIKIKWTQMPHAETKEKLTLMFASGDYPDVLWGHNQSALYNQLGMEGYMQDVIPLLPKVPNYRKYYTDFQWNMTFESRRASNNKLYYMPQFRPWAVTNGIVYRKDEFDRLGLSSPKTVDELVNNLMAIKKEHPDSIPWGNKWGIAQIMDPLKMAYQVTDGLYIDPYTNELVPYGGTTDKMRKVIKVLHTLYKEDLIDREYATVTTTQFEDKIRQDRIYMVAASFIGWLNKFNIINGAANPDAEWVMADVAPTANGKLAYNPVVNGQPWGPAFSDKITGKKLDRYLELIDWLCTEEGAVFQSYGVEGETFNVVKGVKTYADHIDVSTPEKIKPASMGMTNFTIWSWDAILAAYGTDAPFVYHNRILNDSSYKPFRMDYPFLFGSDMERDEYNNLDTIIDDTYKEYLNKFVMGDLDPNSNADWDFYLNEMKKAGIDKYIKISLDAYEKTYKQ